MSDVRPVPMPRPAPVEFRYSQADSFAAVPRKLGVSLVITTYQANKLLVARATDEGLSMLVRTFDRPMGLAIRDDRVALGCRNQVWEFRNALAIAPLVEPAGRHDACYVPRSLRVTGDLWRPRTRLGGPRVVGRQHALLVPVHARPGSSNLAQGIHKPITTSSPRIRSNAFTSTTTRPGRGTYPCASSVGHG